MSHDPQPLGGKIISKPVMIFGPLIVICMLLIVKRLVFGLGSVSDLNGGFPWGVWIAFDLLIGTGFACGGWALAWALGSFLVLGIYRLFGESPIDGLAEVLTHTIGWDIGSVLLPWVDALLTSLVGLIAGGLGGWVVVRELTTPTHDARRAR